MSPRRAEECWEGTRDIFSRVPPTISHNKIRDLALDSGSLINNPRRLPLVMQQGGGGGIILFRYAPLRYDIRTFAGNESWRREEATVAAAWEPRDSGHGISLNDNPSFLDPPYHEDREEGSRTPRARTRTHLPYSHLHLFLRVALSPVRSNWRQDYGEGTYGFSPSTRSHHSSRGLVGIG